MRVSSVITLIMLTDFCLAFTNVNFPFRPQQKPQLLRYNMHQNWEDDMSYLDSLDKKPQNSNIDKLKSIQNNITKYIEEKSKKTDQSQVFPTRYNNPIHKASFDKIFLNINNIRTVYIPNDYDRAIFVMNKNEKFVFYIHNKDEKHLVEKIINLIGKQVKVVVLCNKSDMTDPFGRLYCDIDY